MNEQLEKLFGPNFKLKEIVPGQASNSMGILDINLLESNKVFSYLRKELELYYKEKNKPVRLQTLHSYRSQAWKETFYSSLHKLLNEVHYTTDPQIQDTLVNKVYKWYAEKSQRPIPVPKPINPQPQIEEKLIPVILQNIESTDSPTLPKILPKLPKNLEISENFSNSSTSFKPQTAGVNFFSPFRKRKSKYALKLVQKSQDTPKILDFRTNSVSAETMRTTNYTDRDLKDKPLTANECNPRIRTAYMEQVNEVEMIKKRLASKNMSLPIRTLESGLIFSDYIQEILPPCRLPKGGELLLKDLSVKKEGKKKRKKGKKAK